MSFKFNVMEIPGKFGYQTQLSLQYASGIMAVPGAYELFCDLAKTEVNKQFEDIAVELGSLKRIEQVSSIAYCDDLLWTLSHDFVKQYNVLLNNKVKQMAKALKKKINEFSFKVKGFYGKIVADPGVRYGCPLLGPDEIYVGGDFFKGECDVARYPHNFSGEHFLCKGISRKTLLARIDQFEAEGKLSEDAAFVCREFVSLLKEGSIIVPSWYKRFTQLTGGSDYDGDGVCVFTDSRILKLVKQVPSMAIDFGNPKDAGLAVPDTFNIWCKDYVYRMALANPNDPVGVITNRGMGFVALAEKLQTMSEEEFCKLHEFLAADKELEELFRNNQPYTRRYTGESVIIDAAEVGYYEDGVLVPGPFWQAVLECGMNTRENMLAIMQDAQPVTSSVGGRSIDSAKTGEQVFAPFQAFGRKVKAGMIQSISLNVEEDETHALTFTFNPISTGFCEKTYVVEDTITKVKNRAGKYACAMLQQFYDEAVAGR